MLEKVTSRYKTLLLLTLFLIFIITPYLAARTIEIKIYSYKTEYLVREPILIHFEVKNKNGNPIILSFGLFGEYFKIKDEKGQSYANLFLGEYALTDTLKPNESYESRANISDRYRIVDAGVYTIVMETPAGDILPETKSNIIEIKVKNPTGDEKKALSMLLEADKLKFARDEEGKKDLAKRELGFQKYQDLVDKYPNSIYASLSLNSATGIYKFSTKLEERRKIIPVCRKLIENYPNSLYFNSAFMSLVDVYEILKDKEGAIKIMNELIEKHPDTKISEEAGKRLKRIEEWKF